MPSQVSNATAIRADGYSTRVHASFYAPDPIIEATVTAAPNTQPITFLTVSIDSGDYTDIYGGMRVDVLTPNGDLKGRTRIRYGNTITSTVFHIRETSNAKLNVEVNDLVRVYPEVRLSDLLTEANQLFSPDGTPVGDFNENPPPIINSGGAWAGWVDDGETFASVIMTHSTSFVVDPDSGGTINHLTVTQTGVAIASGDVDTDPDVTLEVNVGQYLIRHEGEDDDNSKTGYSHTPVIVHDADNPPHEVLVTAYDGTPEDGFSWTIEILDGATDLATIPDGCLCILWTDERYAGAWASYRNTAPGREHILGVGYCTRDSTNIGEDGFARVSIDVVSPLARLKQLTSYSKVMEENASPDHWNEIKTLGVKRGHIQIHQWYTNLFEIFDVAYDSALQDYRYPALYLQKYSAYEQGNELLRGIDARITCDRTGRFSIHTSPWLIPLDDRAAITKTWRFNRADILELSCVREHYERVEKYRFSGFTGGASGNQPIFSDYPGEAPGEGIDALTLDRLIAADQDDLNERAGRHGAFVDQVAVDADGARWRVSELTLTLWGAYNFFEFSKEFVDFTETFTALGRTDLTDFLWVPVSTSTSYDENGAAITTLVLRVASNGLPGESYFPPGDEDNGLPPIGDPDFGWGWNPVIRPPLGLGSNNLMIGADDNNLRFTENGTAPAPHWLVVALSSITGAPTGTLLGGAVDAFSARYISGGSTVDGYLWTTTQFCKIEDSFNATGNRECVNVQSFRDTSSFRAGNFERSVPGWGIIVSDYGADGVWAWYTTDGGATDNEVQITAFYDTALNGWSPGIWLDPHTPGRAITSAFTATGSGTGHPGHGFITTDYGATWTQITVPDIEPNQILASSIVAPFTLPTTFYFGHGTLSGFNYDLRLYRAVGGASAADVSPTYSAASYGVRGGGNREVAIADDDALSVVVIGRTNTASASTGVFITRNGAASWTPLIVPGSNPYVTLYMGGRRAIYLLGTNGAFAFSDGETVEDRTGDISTSGTNVVLWGG